MSSPETGERVFFFSGNSGKLSFILRGVDILSGILLWKGSLWVTVSKWTLRVHVCLNLLSGFHVQTHTHSWGMIAMIAKTQLAG